MYTDWKILEKKLGMFFILVLFLGGKELGGSTRESDLKRLPKGYFAPVVPFKG